MNITSFVKVLTGAAVLGMLASCTNESLEDAGTDKQNDFTVSWLKRFGLIDPTQTWNTAEKVMITVDAGVLGSDGTIYLYEKDPSTGARSIARFDAPGDYIVDIYRGTEMLYGRVYDSAGNCQEVNYSLSAGSRGETVLTARAADSGSAGQYGRWLLAAEDLGSTDDYDFNDIVISIYNQVGSQEVEVTAMAAGGIYEANVYYKDVFVFEIHQALGSPKKKTGSYSMLNTNSFRNAGETKIVKVDDDFDITRNMGDFRIEVITPKSKVESEIVAVGAPATGSAPQMLLMPYSWEWPKENVRIDVAYPNFKNWSRDAGKFDFWSEKVKAGSTVSHT